MTVIDRGCKKYFDRSYAYLRLPIVANLAIVSISSFSVAEFGVSVGLSSLGSVDISLQGALATAVAGAQVDEAIGLPARRVVLLALAGDDCEDGGTEGSELSEGHVCCS
jgi:hypothetical protein